MIYEIKKNVFSVGASDPDRKLFDALIPLPDGTSYNSYLLIGSDKVILIDTVDPSKKDILLGKISEVLTMKNLARIDYIVANHAEQDHSGSIPFVLEKYPDAKVLCSDKCRQFLKDLLDIPDEKIQIVADKEKISLGDKTLEFIYTPWVHWPETMVTYLHEEKVLFSCDFFGSHLATEDMIVHDEIKFEIDLKRYFAEIMSPFRIPIRNNILKLQDYSYDVIAPSHGPISNNPKVVVDFYKKWILDDVSNSVLLVYVSMHGSTKLMIDQLESNLINKGISVHKYDLSSSDLGNIAMDLVDCATIVVGTPCVLAGIHPAAANLLYLVNLLRPKTKFISVIGSFSWAGKVLDEVTGLLKNVKAEMIPPVIIKGTPKKQDVLLIEKLAEEIYEKHKSIGV